MRADGEFFSDSLGIFFHLIRLFLTEPRAFQVLQHGTTGPFN